MMVDSKQILDDLHSKFDAFQSLAKQHKHSHAQIKALFKHTQKLHATLRSIVQLSSTYDHLISPEERDTLRREEDTIQKALDVMRKEINTQGEDADANVDDSNAEQKTQRKQKTHLKNPMYTIVDSQNVSDAKTTRTDITTTQTTNTPTNNTQDPSQSQSSSSQLHESTGPKHKTQRRQQRQRQLLSNSSALRVSTDDTLAVLSATETDPESKPLSNDIVSILEKSKKRLPYTTSSSDTYSSELSPSLLLSDNAQPRRKHRMNDDTISSFGDVSSQSEPNFTLHSLPTHQTYRNQYHRKHKLYHPQTQTQTQQPHMEDGNNNNQHGGQLLQLMQLHTIPSTRQLRRRRCVVKT